MNKEELKKEIEGCEFCGIKENCSNFYAGKKEGIEETEKYYEDLMFKQTARYISEIKEHDKKIAKWLADYAKRKLLIDSEVVDKIVELWGENDKK